MKPYLILTLTLILLGISLASVLCYAVNMSSDTSPAQQQPGLRLPDIPSALTKPRERAAFLVEHYWEHFDFSDTTLIRKPEITEQALADFINILLHVPYDKAAEALTALMDSSTADSDMFAHFIELSDKYLNDPNSPLRSEEFYIPVLKYIVASPKLDDTDKIRPQFQLDMALKNRPGNTAADFTYTLSDGSRHRMRSLKAEYTLLYFNNPDCRDCRRVSEYMAASPIIKRFVSEKKGRTGLAILAVYPEGDIALWKKAEYPRWIINCYDAEQVIMDKQLYDLQAIPTLYLLDKNKRVILKDAPIEQVEAWLKNY